MASPGLKIGVNTMRRSQVAKGYNGGAWRGVSLLHSGVGFGEGAVAAEKKNPLEIVCTDGQQ